MNKIQNGAAFIFIICVIVLAIISILAVWQEFDQDILMKSIQTIGLLAGVSALVITSGRFLDSRSQKINSTENPMGNETPVVIEINPAFTHIRRSIVVILIISTALLALLGVLAIWDVASGDILNKSLSSIAIVAFSSLMIVFTCLEREHHKLMQKKISGSMIFLIIILIWTFSRFLFN